MKNHATLSQEHSPLMYLYLQSESDFLYVSISPQKQSPVLWFHSWNTDQISLIHSECHDTIESHNSLQLKPWSLWKTMWSLLKKTTSRATIWSSDFTSGFIFRRNKDGVMKRQRHSHVYCSILFLQPPLWHPYLSTCYMDNKHRSEKSAALKHFSQL